MGTDKATVEIGGVPMIDYVAGVARQVTRPVIVVGGVERSGTLRTIPDAGAPHQGPLAGVVAALRAAEGPILALAVDQPFVQREFLEQLLARFDGHRPVVPVDQGVLQVTCAVYPSGFLALGERHLQEGGSLWRALRESDLDAWKDWPGDGRSWLSIDTPEALEEAIGRFGHPPI